MKKPYRLLHGDCLESLEGIDPKSIDAVVTDPPYGVRHKTDSRRFSGGKPQARFRKSVRRNYPPVIGDDATFDPSPWIKFRKAVLFGSNCYSDKLPPGSALVWCKKPANTLGKFMGDCEIAWRKGGHGVYLFHHVWNGACRETERRTFLHPTQKPVALMRWVIEGLKLKPGSTILDPFMGSGPVGVAAVELGFNFIGVEIDRAYFDIAEGRIADALRARAA